MPFTVGLESIIQRGYEFTMEILCRIREWEAAVISLPHANRGA